MKKKLIEVALPLDAINKASAREKSIRHGHPSTLHLWWARRPLAAARAVIFAQMVDDPSAHPDLFPTAKAQEKERQRLFRIIEDLVLWENTTNEKVLQQARDEIWQSWRYTCAENADHPRSKELFDRFKLPAFHDPFAGGGSLPLEAQRLGLESYASDLNPVAVLINKAMIEIPPKFFSKPPVNPNYRTSSHSDKDQSDGKLPIQQDLFTRKWIGAQGLAEDIRYYGKWMRDEAEKRIGHLYPKIEVTEEMAKERLDLKKYVGQKLTVIAWLWARTVKSPNPAFAHIDVPLISNFMLATQSGKEAYVEPVIKDNNFSFRVKIGKPKDVKVATIGTKLARGSFSCLLTGIPIGYDYINNEANAGRMSERLMAIVAEGEHGRTYLSPTLDHEAIAREANPKWKPDVQTWGTGGSNAIGRRYGFHVFGDLFTQRQLVALATLSDLVLESVERVTNDAIAAELPNDNRDFDSGGSGAKAYADAVALYLAFTVDRAADAGSSVVSWTPQRETPRNTFARQVIPMAWDFTEINPFSHSAGNVYGSIEWARKVIELLPAYPAGRAVQADAASQSISQDKVISADPPYYDNIGYSDLSDFFYVWLRRSIRPLFSDVLSTLITPKAEELVAFYYRHESKAAAAAFFVKGMTRAMQCLSQQAHPAFPVTIYYAFKQSETANEEGTASTGWETFLEAVICAGFAVSGTWPIRTERESRSRGIGSNALASSIILVCRKRAVDAPTVTRREFVTVLKSELLLALTHLQRGNIAPVDLAQAAIGPGMGVYTRYAKVLDAEGKSLSVRDALTLINQTLDEALAEQEGDFDADSRWALAWFEHSGFLDGEYGVAEMLSKAKNTSVSGMVEAGILVSSRGNVRLLRPDELFADWDPTMDKRLTAWEVVHQLIRALESGGEPAAASLVARLGENAEIARELAYRLYTLCERKKRSAEALSYNGLVQSWPEISRLASESMNNRSHLIQKELI